MKQCPVCKNTYTDETLRFCLADGAALYNRPATTEITQEFSGGTAPIRVNIGQEETPTIVAKYDSPNVQPREKSKSGLIIGILTLILLLLVLISGGVIGWLLLNNKETGNTNTKPESSPANSITKNSTPNDAEVLKEKLANLERKIQEQKTTKPTVPTISNTNPAQTNKTTARVNSPNDGFLALRTEPNSETGERILQIPHGASVTVNACLPKETGKKGRWCRVDYNGNSGWAFDGFLIY